MGGISKFSNSVFEQIKRINDYGMECWSARELQEALDYSQWRNFSLVFEKAKLACITSGFDVEDHFADVSKMVKVGSDAIRKIMSDGFDGLPFGVSRCHFSKMGRRVDFKGFVN
jgi:DNA-damage-inducible protein D